MMLVSCSAKPIFRRMPAFPGCLKPSAGNQPSHYAGDAVAIVLQVVKCGVADVVQVHSMPLMMSARMAFRQPEGGGCGFEEAG